MKVMISVLSIVVLAFFIVPVGAQGHASHHSGQNAIVQADSARGMGMMKGGMMGGKGMMQGGMMHSNMMGRKTMMGGMMTMCKQMMKGGMMGGSMMSSMMGGMMGMHSPLMKSMHTIHHLPQLQSKLNLSDAQVEKLKTMQSVFLKEKIDLEASTKKKEIDLQQLIDKNAPVSKIRAVLKTIYDNKFRMQVTAYETAQKMLSVLSEDQLKKYKNQTTNCSKMMGSGMMK